MNMMISYQELVRTFPSLAGLSEDIYSYLKKSWKDVPVAGTVEKWLKESGLNPDVKPKNRNFELIISEGE